MSAKVSAPILIVGPHRAGSTLWHNLIAMSPRVMRLAEPRFLGPARQKDFRFFLQTQARSLSSYADLEKMVELCFSRKGFAGLEGAFWRFEGIAGADDPKLKHAIADRIHRSDRSLGAIARIFIEEVTFFAGCDRPCVKFPVDVEHLPTLLEWFPDGKIVHITRDPRALAMSKSNDPSGTAIKLLEHPRLSWLIRKGALWLTVKQYRLAARVHDQLRHVSNYRLFRYEDLLAYPEDTLRELCHFIEIEFHGDMLDPNKGRHEHQPSSLTGERRKGFDPGAGTRWKKVISPLDNFLIVLLTRSSMKKLGYDFEDHPIYGLTQDKGLAKAPQEAAIEV